MCLPLPVSLQRHPGRLEHFQLDDELLLEGSFGDIDVVLEPLGLARWTLNFKGEHDLNNGTYSCSDFYYASFACSFSYTD